MLRVILLPQRPKFLGIVLFVRRSALNCSCQQVRLIRLKVGSNLCDYGLKSWHPWSQNGLAMAGSHKGLRCLASEGHPGCVRCRDHSQTISRHLRNTYSHSLPPDVPKAWMIRFVPGLPAILAACLCTEGHVAGKSWVCSWSLLTLQLGLKSHA